MIRTQRDRLAVLLLVCSVVVFFWDILFTRQFSLLMQYESANDAYAWNNFAAASARAGELPLWDPYTFSGRSFIGELQTAVFYPLKVVLLFWPPEASGLFSRHAYHVFHVFTQFLAAFLMYRFGRYVGLRHFPAVLAGLSFSLSGFLGRTAWPHMRDSAIWLPLVLLLYLRACEPAPAVDRILRAAMAGGALALAFLAGGLHVMMMDVLVLVAVAAWRAFAPVESRPAAVDWRWAAALLATTGLFCFLLSAIQFLPSVEYSKLSIRFIGDVPPVTATSRMPYAYVGDGYSPKALWSLLFVFPFDGNVGGGETNAYFGVLPLVLAVAGAVACRRLPWVRFLSGVAIVAFILALGKFAFLHGLAYIAVPYAWFLREPVRWSYILHFALALLAGFGAQTLLRSDEGDAREFWSRLFRHARWVLAGLAAALTVPALFVKAGANEWLYFSFTLFLMTYGALWYAHGRGDESKLACLLLLGVAMSDWKITAWNVLNVLEMRAAGGDHLEQLMSLRPAADFLKARPGPFRVDVAVLPQQPNIGDVYGVQMIWGMAASAPERYYRFYTQLTERAADLLNAKYMVTNKDQGRPALFADGTWFVYERAGSLPRAWMVHNVETAATFDDALRRMAEPAFDARRTAIVERDAPTLPAPQATGSDDVRVTEFGASRISLRVRAASAGLLVASETWFPGWVATVDGEPARIHRVNGVLRGVVVGEGDHRVEFAYAPVSFAIGSLLTLYTAGLLVALLLARKLALAVCRIELLPDPQLSNI